MSSIKQVFSLKTHMINRSVKIGRRQTCIVIAIAAIMSIWISPDTAHAESSDLNSFQLYPDRFVAPDDSAWIYDVGTLLHGDNDGDGYFSGISLSIDADTAYLSYRVFINIDITPIGSNRSERLHTTYPFYIYSNSFTDEYRVDIDLVQNFDPQLYDLSISLVGDGNGIIVDQVSANDFRNLRSLSLESENNEDVFAPVIDRPVGSVDGNVRVEEYAGSTSFLLLAILLVSRRIKIRARLPRKSRTKTA